MAKCSLCNSRKGKRKCQIDDTWICSLCCGTSRIEEKCIGCSYYKKPKRKYNEVPKFTTIQMEKNTQLADYANIIEGALCSYDMEIDNKLKDSDAIKILELLIDRYHFLDKIINTDDWLIISGLKCVENAIKQDLSNVEKEILIKILAVIRFVANRRTKLGREYMNIIHRYVGQRIDSDIRLLTDL